MPDEFIRAFHRFEQMVDTRNIHTFAQLREAFALWAGERWIGSEKQNLALIEQAHRLGIHVIIVYKVEYVPPRPPIEFLQVERVPTYYGVKVQTPFGARYQYPRGTVIGSVNVGGRFFRGGPYYTAVSPSTLKHAYMVKHE